MFVETPISFVSEKQFPHLNIKYIDLNEIGQGGPEIGKLLINDILVSKHLFGGPFLKDENFIYLPIYLKSFFHKGFKIAKVDFKTFEIEMLGNFKNLINLYKIDKTFIYYFTDLDGTLSNKIIK